MIGNSGVKLENHTPCALLKEIHLMQDCFGEDIHLYYLKTKDGKEIDFLVVQDETPRRLIEVKWADDAPSSNFSIFGRHFPEIQKTQIVRSIKHEKTFPDGTEIRAAHAWLTDFSLP